MRHASHHLFVKEMESLKTELQTCHTQTANLISSYKHTALANEAAIESFDWNQWFALTQFLRLQDKMIAESHHLSSELTALHSRSMIARHSSCLTDALEQADRILLDIIQAAGKVESIRRETFPQSNLVPSVIERWLAAIKICEDEVYDHVQRYLDYTSCLMNVCSNLIAEHSHMEDPFSNNQIINPR